MHSMLQRFLPVLLTGLLAFGQAQAAEPLRVLFIGNSYTFVNDMPHMVRQMSLDAGQPRPVVTDDVTFSGATLKLHWDRGNVEKALKNGPWDYVVIQDHSRMPVDDEAETRQYTKLVADAAKAAGAKPILYLTWARQNDPSMQAKLDRVYTELANQTGSLLAPVGQAWQTALGESTPPGLFLKDGSHPSYAGSYLTASVFYSLIYGAEPPAASAKALARMHLDSADGLHRDAWGALQSLDTALRTVPDTLRVGETQASR